MDAESRANHTKPTPLKAQSFLVHPPRAARNEKPQPQRKERLPNASFDSAPFDKSWQTFGSNLDPDSLPLHSFSLWANRTTLSLKNAVACVISNARRSKPRPAAKPPNPPRDEPFGADRHGPRTPLPTRRRPQRSLRLALPSLSTQQKTVCRPPITDSPAGELARLWPLACHPGL